MKTFGSKIEKFSTENSAQYSGVIFGVSNAAKSNKCPLIKCPTKIKIKKASVNLVPKCFSVN